MSTDLALSPSFSMCLSVHHFFMMPNMGSNLLSSSLCNASVGISSGPAVFVLLKCLIISLSCWACAYTYTPGDQKRYTWESLGIAPEHPRRSRSHRFCPSLPSFPEGAERPAPALAGQ